MVPTVWGSVFRGVTVAEADGMRLRTGCVRSVVGASSVAPWTAGVDVSETSLTIADSTTQRPSRSVHSRSGLKPVGPLHPEQASDTADLPVRVVFE
jgi:hypothetical protein